MTTDRTERREGAGTGTGGIVAAAALSICLVDLLHEAGHLAATMLSVGVTPLSISTIGVSSRGVSAVVAAAGPGTNLLFSVCLLGALSRRLPPAWRYLAWLFGSGSLFNATAYLIYSAASATGDWAVVFDALSRSGAWRLPVAAAGCVVYAASVLASARALRALCSEGIVAAANVERYCALSYVAGGVVLTVGAALNPVSPWYVLTSGASTGFGAMAGLMLIPSRLRDLSARGDAAAHESLELGGGWIAAGVVAVAVFVGVFGPGVRFAR
jgi:hypothetical protein